MTTKLDASGRRPICEEESLRRQISGAILLHDRHPWGLRKGHPLEVALQERANHDKSLVALSSVLAAVLLTGMKLVVGVGTHS
jgi:hypothetical protein